MYRAKRAVVSGDEHQLPPTSFFQAGFDIGSDSEVETQIEELERKLEEEPDNEELVAEYERLQNATEAKSAENILDIGKRILPQSWLTIHYRSRFSELIRFSNVAFYESKLRMPVAHPPESLSSQKPIDLRRINSVYSQDQTNRGEAEEVVKYLRRLWMDNMGPIATVGVVTFNIHQREAILDALDYECERDRTFAQISVFGTGAFTHLLTVMAASEPRRYR